MGCILARSSSINVTYNRTSFGASTRKSLVILAQHVGGASSTSKSRSQSVAVEKVDNAEILTPVYVPYLAHEKRHGLRRPRSTTREPFCPRRNRSSVVAASVFKTAASPRILYPYQRSPVHPQRHLYMVVEADKGQNASSNDGRGRPNSHTYPLRPAHVRKYRPR